jgi:hypothetical protein
MRKEEKVFLKIMPETPLRLLPCHEIWSYTHFQLFTPKLPVSKHYIPAVTTWCATTTLETSINVESSTRSAMVGRLQARHHVGRPEGRGRSWKS